MLDDQIIGFVCKTCKETLSIGKCGIHRVKTGHKEFQEILSKSIIGEKNEL